jgi:SAM-dependent methyltransferase
LHTKVQEIDMGEEKRKVGDKQSKDLKYQASGKLFSKILPWHISLAIVEPISRLFEPPKRLIGLMEPYIKNRQVVADLGCGRGYYALALAKLVGSEGKVYAVDLDKKCIRALERKSDKGAYHNIEAHASSAAAVGFIKDKSVDFVFANGLLCSMADHRESAVKEIKRILKTTGQAYLSLGFGPPLGFIDKAEWERIIGGFKVERGGTFKEKWAVVSLKQDL